MTDIEHTAESLSELRRDPLKAALTSAALRGFHISKQFPDNKALITSLDFDISGNKCITTSMDESLRIYDCVQGKREQVLYSKKYGCNLAQFTSQPGCVAYASTKINDTIRYLSYDTNQYIRYFVGHSRQVTSLQRSPVAATVMSAALDGVVNVWDLGSVKPASTVTPACLAAGGVLERGIAAAYDPSGMVVAVAVGSAELQLYDIREITRGPFKSQSIRDVSGHALVAGIQFTPPLGDQLLLAMTDGSCQLLDAFSLQPRAHLIRASAPGSRLNGSRAMGGDALSSMQAAHLGQNVSVTPDGRSVIAGDDLGSILHWSISQPASGHLAEQGTVQLEPSGVWNGSHDGAAGVCAFHPHIMECVTGSQSLAFWTTPS
ncbi:hypothetical protein GGI02_005495 [Coemansia sp. RSA 2322]|nr:hypothetical protein GGI02_005495 [Coemansia sp. RSA 2322]